MGADGPVLGISIAWRGMGERSETGTGTTIHSTARGAYLYVGVGNAFSLGLLPIYTSELARAGPCTSLTNGESQREQPSPKFQRCVAIPVHLSANFVRERNRTWNPLFKTRYSGWGNSEYWIGWAAFAQEVPLGILSFPSTIHVLFIQNRVGACNGSQTGPNAR